MILESSLYLTLIFVLPSFNLFYYVTGPPPPPPQIFNCGELRERHHGRLVEIEGKVNRSKGRFLELKDQHGCIQCVSPPGVSFAYSHDVCAA